MATVAELQNRISPRMFATTTESIIPSRVIVMAGSWNSSLSDLVDDTDVVEEEEVEIDIDTVEDPLSEDDCDPEDIVSRPRGQFP